MADMAPSVHVKLAKSLCKNGPSYRNSGCDSKCARGLAMATCKSRPCCRCRPNWHGGLGMWLGKNGLGDWNDRRGS